MKGKDTRRIDMGQEPRTTAAELGQQTQTESHLRNEDGSAPETRSRDLVEMQSEGGDPRLQCAVPIRADLHHDLFEKALTHWQFGDWTNLAKLADEPLDEHPNRARLALLVATGLLQLGLRESGEDFVRRAREWGCDIAQIRRVLVAGVYNSLARARLLQGREGDGARLIKLSCTSVMPEREASLVIPARIAHQAAALGQRQPQRVFAFNSDENRDDPGLSHARHSRAFRSDATITERLYRVLDRLIEGLIRSREDLTLDGVRVFETKDPFLPGKIALGLSYRVMSCAHNDRELLKACRDFRAVDELTRDREQESWGIQFYLAALSRLKQFAVLEKTFSPDRLDELRRTLDWRGFVDESTYELKGKPNNFYGVAFSIAQRRANLGWDDPCHAEVLLQKMVEHYREYSGDFGFADETGGQGRYDRYSILLIGEIAHHFREAKRPLPVELQNWLRNSAEVVLVNLNRHGGGFQFGRSIGAYGDAAFLEVLSAAAWHGLLSPVESRVAYTFSRIATRKFLDFWYDDTRQAVNLWEDGRRTEAYRGKHRILGETISLLHQHLYTHRIWRQLRTEASDAADAEFEAWLKQRPRFTLTRFSDQTYARAMLTARDGEHVFVLPLVNGARYHDYTAYLPVPFAHGLVRVIPDERFPQLVPRIELDDGTLMMPLAFMRNITVSESENGATLALEQTELDALGENKPIPDSRVAVRTRFEFTPGCITRTDEFIPTVGVDVHRIHLEFATDATGAQWDGSNVHFETGGLDILALEGYQAYAIEDVSDDPAFASPEGSLSTRVRWQSTPQMRSKSIKLSWSFHYPL